MISQAKIDLAVLLKLFHHAEMNGEAETPAEIARFFTVSVSKRRIELALETLEGRGEIEREYHPHYVEEGLWQISREGLRTVEKALRLPNSFLARLNAQGDAWLETDEAKSAELSRNSRYDATALNRPPLPAPSPSPELQQTETDVPAAVPLQSSINWTKWGTIIGALGLIVTILIAVF